jgi:hypothetical protein
MTRKSSCYGVGDTGRESYICANFDGTINRSGPMSALPVARIRLAPLAVSGSSVVPVCRPSRDHSVSPWRMMKARGVVIAGGGRRRGG